jgi:VWFA-related protein
MRTRCVSVGLFALYLLCGAPVPAQNATPAEPGPTIRTTVTEVNLDIVVRDKKGKLVRNLKPSDVQIYEDGVLQQIRSFRLAAGHTEAETTTATAPGTPASSVPLRKVNLVCIVFHNQDNLDVSMKKFTLEAVQQFLQTQWQPDTWVGVFALGSRLIVLHPFTTNRTELLRAAALGFSGGTFQLARVADAVLNGTPNLDVIQGIANQAAHTGGFVESLQTGQLNNAAILDVTQNTGLASNAQRGDLVDQQRDFGHIQGMQSNDQVKLLIQELAQLPGHKTVLMLSAGLPSEGNPELFDALLRQARQADMSVYALDTNGLSENSNLLAANAALQNVSNLSQQESRSGLPANMVSGQGSATTSANANTTTTGSVGQEAELARQDDYLHTAVRSTDTQAPLRALSEGTGGFLIGGTNDFRKAFQRLNEDVGMHYEAIYHPSSNIYDGHLRKIEVRMARADYTVESRTGYFAVPTIHGSSALSGTDVAGLTVLNSKPLPHAFDFSSAAWEFRSAGASRQIGVAFELPASTLTATPQTELKNHRLHVSLLALVKDSSGEIVDKFSQDSSFEIPDDKLASVQTMPITWTHPFDLPPGHYTLEAALLDHEGNRASTVTLPIDNPERKSLEMSNVMLVERVETLKGKPDPDNPFEFATTRVVPQLRSSLDKGEQPYVYFVVYPDKTDSENARIEVEFLVNGQSLAKQTADLPAPDATGAVPMVVSAALKTGDCELKITAMQGNSSVSQSVKYAVAAQ